MSENLQTSIRGGFRAGVGRPRKEKKNAKRQISIPPDLDVRLKKMAAKENVSFSSLIVRLVQLGLESD